MITQSNFIQKFSDDTREHFNPDLFKRDNQDLIDSIYKVVKSCEKDKYFTLKLLSFTPITDYEEIYNTLRDHEEKRRKKNSKDPNLYDFINIRDTDMMLIKVEWLIRHNGIERQETENKTIEVVNPEKVLEVLIALPRFVKGYYFRLSGNYYTTAFQIVDGSTYNNSYSSQSKVDTVSLKTMFAPARFFRGFRDMVDINTNEKFKAIEYNSIIFNTSCNAMLYILANYGLYGASVFFDIDCINICREPYTNPDYLCFEKNGIYITCPKVCFQDAMVQSFVATIYGGILKETTIEDLFNQRYWLKLLGMSFKNASVEKGLFILDSIDGIYDITTKEDLHLEEKDKANIYTAMRWVIREFSNLRTKDNADVRTKRLRISDYIAQLYATRLNKGLHRITDLGKRITLKKVEQAIYTTPLYILNNLSGMSNLISYRDLVNDNDALTALKFTYKGISGLGEDGSKVQPVYRYIDPSYIGILDLDSSSVSDPGMNGFLCPMAKVYNHSFSQYKEPDEWENGYRPLANQYKDGTDSPLEFFDESKKPVFQYQNFRDQIVDEELEIDRVTCPIYSLTDPDKTYTCSQTILEESEEDKPQSLFDLMSQNQ